MLVAEARRRDACLYKGYEQNGRLEDDLNAWRIAAGTTFDILAYGSSKDNLSAEGSN